MMQTKIVQFFKRSGANDAPADGHRSSAARGTPSKPSSFVPPVVSPSLRRPSSSSPPTRAPAKRPVAPARPLSPSLTQRGRVTLPATAHRATSPSLLRPPGPRPGNARPAAHASRLHVVSLYDLSTYALQPWADAGFECHAYDIAHAGTATVRKNITVHKADLYNPLVRERIRQKHAGRCAFAFAFPPCTNLSIAGARWFAKKRAENPRFMEVAAQNVIDAANLCKAMGGIHAVENPRTSRLSVLWRTCDHWFNPCDYGGYVPSPGTHPVWPNKIPAYDAYEKPTGLWTSPEFVMPSPKRVKPTWRIFGGKKPGSRKRRISPLFYGTGVRVRNATPRGFARAVFKANQQRATRHLLRRML